MKTENIMVANLKCGGCASSIRKALQYIPGVREVQVDVENDIVTVSAENVSRKILTDKLYSLGYPEATEENGLLLQIKSYGSCVIGQIDNLKTV